MECEKWVGRGPGKLGRRLQLSKQEMIKARESLVGRHNGLEGYLGDTVCMV